jgi:transposase
MNNKEILKLKTILESKDFWTTDEVKDLVKEKFGVDYCLNSIRELLKKIRYAL